MNFRSQQVRLSHPWHAISDHELAGERVVMGNSFLEEQLQRMRRLTERMAQMHSEVGEAMARDRKAQRVRDYRTHQTHDYPDRAEDRSSRRSRGRRKIR
jgi:hypothetical protein